MIRGLPLPFAFARLYVQPCAISGLTISSRYSFGISRPGRSPLYVALRFGWTVGCSNSDRSGASVDTDSGRAPTGGATVCHPLFVRVARLTAVDSAGGPAGSATGA